MNNPSMKLSLAIEYRRWWLLNQAKENFVMPAFIQEAHRTLEWYEMNPNHQSMIPAQIIPPQAQQVAEKVRPYKKRVVTVTILGPTHMQDLKKHPELTIKEMADRIGCSYSHMVDLVKKNHIEHYCRYQRHKAA